MDMFCRQCEQTTRGTACLQVGICGKEAETAALQDLLVHVTMGTAVWAGLGRPLGLNIRGACATMTEAIFATLTNVNFDTARIAAMVLESANVRDRVRSEYLEACASAGVDPARPEGPALLAPKVHMTGMLAQGAALSGHERKRVLGDDIAGLYDLLLLGLKGVASYAWHVQTFGMHDDGVCGFLCDGLARLAGGIFAVPELLERALECGGINMRVMEMLDAAHTGAFGDPVPVKVRTSPIRGKAILVSGHDLKTLHDLLALTAGAGINVYTHGEMLPAHGYPGLRKYRHLAGNYGGAWQDQQREFNEFPGPILMTTNCIQKPSEAYRRRIFTTGPAGWPGVRHLKRGGFDPLLETAAASPGFTFNAPDRNITVGFGRNTLVSSVRAMAGMIRSGRIRRVFVVGGCDGAMEGRSYFTELAKIIPEDCVVLTMACGKYRFNKIDFGSIGGIPRLMDAGQCNDAFAAVKFTLAMAEELGTDANSLPISFILSWFEQKAVAVLLTLLHLGIKDIRLGPSLPAFLTPAVLKTLSERFGLKPTIAPAEDLKTALGG
jgi:hydroxylamine reductase